MKLTKEQIFMIYRAHKWCKAANSDYPNQVFETIGGLTEDNEIWLHAFGDWSSNYEDFNKTKLILRKIEDITEAEKKVFNDYILTIKTLSFEDHMLMPALILIQEFISWLLSIGIDLFGAIELGFAINEKELK